MKTPRRLESAQEIMDRVTSVRFVNYMQVKAGIKSFNKVIEGNILSFDIEEMLQEIKKKGYIINQLFGPKRQAVENEELFMEKLILMCGYPIGREKIESVIKIDSEIGTKYIFVISFLGQTYTWEIIEQRSKEEIDKVAV
ncbi:MAG: hypothetical protein AWU54_300 [Candidatus Frackibacter sp. T328-2]|nr:MAG: hypothetical protein AWU54_300 [Candidatus Frackibacter sp. T328-2]